MTLTCGRWRFTPGLWPSLATLLVLCLLLGLGTWQLGRSEEKLALAEQYRAALEERAVSLGPGFDYGASDSVYRRVKLRGTYDADRTFLLDNRTRHGVAGYHVLTPVRAAADSSAVLVDRGWVALGPSREHLPDVTLSSPGVARDINGRLARPPRPGLVLGETGYADSGWPRVVQAVDLPAMAAALGYTIEPLVLLLDPDEPDGFDRSWTPYVGIGPERHRGYAVQWYSLATALVAIYIVVNTKKLEAPRNADDLP